MGALPDVRRAHVEAHLDMCSSCGQLVAELARVYGSEAPSVAAPLEAATLPPSGPDASEATRGETPRVGRYVLGRQLGAGGMGVVYEAHDPELQRRVAVKLLHGGVRGDPAAFRSHLLREARAMAQLAHPNVVAVHDVGQVGDRVFLAMELVEGTTLTQWLATGPSREAVLGVFAQAGAGLLAAHGVGLVHRDFKPDNVLIADGRARVTDFGLARPLPHEPLTGPTPVEAALDVSLAATRPGSLVGTPAYMSPEQLRGEPATARSDQFSFCVAVFEALHGRRPFAGLSFAELSSNVLAGRRVPFPGTTPTWLRQTLSRGLSPSPHRRFATMAKLLATFERRKPTRVGALVGLAAAGAGAAAVGGLLLWALPSRSEPPGEAGANDSAAAPGPDTPASGPTADHPICRSNALPWTAARRQAIEKQVALRVLSKDAGPRVGATLDRWATRWIADADAACKTAAAQPIACLGRSRSHFDALATELGDASSIEAEHAFEAATSLAPPTHCRRPIAAPGEPTAAAQVRLAGETIATARAELSLSSQDTVESATHAVSVARQAEHPPIIAEAQVVLGLAQRDAGKPGLAANTLADAIVSATAAEHVDAKLEAALALVEIVGAQQMNTAAVTPWVKLVQADIDTFGDDALRAELALRRSAMLRGVAEYRDAAAAAEDALEVNASAQAHRALARSKLGGLDLDAALEHANAALELDTAQRPARDVSFARNHALRGHILLAQGQPADALSAFEAAKKLRIYPRGYDEDVDAIASEVGRARALAALGRGAEAEEAFKGARVHPQWRQNAAAVAAHARWLGASGRHDDAIVRAREAVGLLEARVGTDDPRLVPVLTELIEVLVGAEQPELAAAALDRTRKLLEAHVEYGPLWGLVHETAARLFALQGDSAAELSELDDAYVTLSGAFGVRHPRIDANVLRRADLAWDLDRKEYAQRLYVNSAKALTARLGANHVDTMRAATRAQAPIPVSGPEP